MISESLVTPHLSWGTFDVAPVTAYPKYLAIAQPFRDAQVVIQLLQNRCQFVSMIVQIVDWC